jgi:polysaccharide deacetylase family protein (PEP-CTERM system associated)
VRNIFSVDVEDYFHPSEVQRSVPSSTWDQMPRRVGFTVHSILELLARHNTRATFFILGWVAETEPALVREIAAAGHEIGCHSFWHRLVYDLTPEEFAADTKQACDAIEAACGIRPTLYRAPSYSITDRSIWALGVLAQLGFTHDSSIYPIRHDRYGIPGFPRAASLLQTAHGPLIEVPPAAVELRAGWNVPVGGGGYLRMLPYRYTAAGIRTLNHVDGMPANVYIHPWEMDREQPRIAQGTISRLRTYLGLAAFERKVDRLLSEFEFGPLGETVAVVAK